MDEIKKVRIPTLIPEIPLPERQVQDRPADSWEFQNGNTHFNYVNGRILMNKQDLAKLISENLTHLTASYWTQISRRLEDYRQWALRHVSDVEQLAMFAAMVHALLTKIGGRLKKKFDEKIDGISFQLEEGQLLLNGINIHAFIEMAKRHPTQKAKIFLKGIKNRLGVMLSNRFGNPNYEKIRTTCEELFAEIDRELVRPAQEIIYLPPKSEI
ncbi:MAG: hypothetical protein U1F57_02420 [bacterium]